MLQLRNITKDYVTASETVHALRGVDLSFRTKEFVSVLGPSGCGKTTLLNIIGGLDKYTSGDLVINGKSTKSFKDRHWDVYRNHRVGFIFQSYNLIPHQTILGNVELALTIAGIDREERIKRAKEALDKVGLAGQYYKRPNQLSGGQCQRVAIARALVNDPEILLADEPTGALDTVTSVQIMELIREIAEERLVIMVTHNPELADKYSTRIVRFLDGLVVEDTNPMTEEEMAEEAKADEAIIAEAARLERENKKASRKAREKAKMSWFTAFRLSARNLLSKKGRTTMVGIAGSIGIIGIAMVLAFSAGIKSYIYSMQDDMLSGNPVEITETGFDASAVMDLMNVSAKIPKDKLADKVYITSVVENLAKMSESLERLFKANTITPEYIEYVKSMPADAYKAMLLSYGIDMSINLFTDFKYDSSSDSEHMSIKRLIDTYAALLKETEYASYATFIPYLVPSMQQAPSNEEYILSQYDLLGGGKVATGENEIMLVLNPDEEISDLLLAAFGYYTQKEFLAIVDKATATDPENYPSKAHYRDYFEYDQLLGKTFVWYPTDSVFSETENDMEKQFFGSYKYESEFDTKNPEGKNGIELKVVGILTPKDTISYGCLTSGIYYTEALTEKILKTNETSAYIEYLKSDKSIGEIGSQTFPIPNPDDPANPTYVSLVYSLLYQFDYRYDDFATENDESLDNPRTPDVDESKGELGENPEVYRKSSYGIISPSSNSMSISGMMMGGSSDPTETMEKNRQLLIRNLGGNSVANNILIYPNSFEEKDAVTSWLDAWNSEDGVVKVNGVDIPAADRTQVTYTDTLALIISIIETMIQAITIALVAFTSVSLVVSTVMIGIITYVSVVERIKEIGVIRSLGGRKRDVGNLFRCETLIIGLLSGLIGVGFTYIASAIVSAIVKNLVGISGIAQLPISQAIILVALSVLLTSISGLIPASSAAKKDPVIALRTE